MAQGDDIFPIPGTKNIIYLEENLDATKLTLTDEEIQAVREIAENVEVAGDRYDPAYVLFFLPPFTFSLHASIISLCSLVYSLHRDSIHIPNQSPMFGVFKPNTLSQKIIKILACSPRSLATLPRYYKLATVFSDTPPSLHCLSR